MALRRGKKSKAEQSADSTADEFDEASPDDTAGADSADGVGEVLAETAAPRRPLDESEAGDDDGVVPRLDLGSIRLPVFSDLEVRIELNDQRQPVAATLLHTGSAVQLLAFAAPRGGGLWDDVRAEIAASVTEGGGQVDEADGVFGPELRARVRSQAPGGQVAEQRLRFVGFDGPRWFVRGVFSGPAATDPRQAAGLEAVLTRVVIVRGDEPMAPRDPLPLRLPSDVAGIKPPADAKPTLDPFTRGPEITEIQ